MVLPQNIVSRKEEITADFLKLMEAHIEALMNGTAERRFAATDFGKLLFIHPRHLTNTLKQVTGKSTCDLMEQRIQHEAEKLLIETDLPVAEIGYRFAYEEATNFTKFFKGMVGVTPLQFRKQHRKISAG